MDRDGLNLEAHADYFLRSLREIPSITKHI